MLVELLLVEVAVEPPEEAGTLTTLGTEVLLLLFPGKVAGDGEADIIVERACVGAPFPVREDELREIVLESVLTQATWEDAGGVAVEELSGIRYRSKIYRKLHISVHLRWR